MKLGTGVSQQNTRLFRIDVARFVRNCDSCQTANTSERNGTCGRCQLADCYIFDLLILQVR